MTEPDEAGWLGEVRAFRPGGEVPRGPGCLDDDTLAALAEGSLRGEMQAAALAHLSTCAACRRAVASVARLLADPEIGAAAGRVAPAGGARVRWLRLAGIGMGTAAAVMLLLWASPPRQPEPHRAPPITASPAPEALSPVGSVAEARSLRWTAVPGADRYRVTLFAADGSVRYETELDQTRIALPDSVLPVPGETWWWKVDARLGFDRWAASELIQFTIERAPRR